MSAQSEYSARRRKRNTAYVQGYLSTHPCVLCGYSGPARHFHHRDPELKKASVGRMVNQGANLERIAEEIAKCDVLCCVCHIEFHVKELGNRPFWA